MSLQARNHTLTKDYQLSESWFDEVFGNGNGVRSPYKPIMNRFSDLLPKKLSQRERRIEDGLKNRGVTFDSEPNPENPSEQTLTVDPVPRVIKSSTWDDHLKPGLFQRVRALNLFLSDIYHDADIVNDGILPYELVFNNNTFQSQQ